MRITDVIIFNTIAASVSKLLYNWHHLTT